MQRRQVFDLGFLSGVSPYAGDLIAGLGFGGGEDRVYPVASWRPRIGCFSREGNRHPCRISDQEWQRSQLPVLLWLIS